MVLQDGPLLPFVRRTASVPLKVHGWKTMRLPFGNVKNVQGRTVSFKDRPVVINGIMGPL